MNGPMIALALAIAAVNLATASAAVAQPASAPTAPTEAGRMQNTETAKQLPRLRVSDNHRFLVTADGKPFFWLGDTTWELFHRLNRQQAEQLLDNRAKNGFNVIQAVAIAELDGHSDPDPYGHLPLTDLDPARPAVKDGPDNDYWDHVDFVVQAANRRGIYVGFLPTWSR